MRRDSISWYRHRIDISAVKAEVFQAIAQNKDTELGSFSLHELDKFIQNRTEKRPPDLDEEALRKAALEVLPPEYHNFIDIFSETDNRKSTLKVVDLSVLDKDIDPPVNSGYNLINQML